MPARREDADQRRFFDEFPRVKVSRFRADGTVDPLKRQAVIPFPNGKSKLIDTAHTKLRYGGGFSYFICPGCAKLAHTLYLIDDAARCRKCCIAMNIQYRSRWGFGRQERMAVSDKYLDELIAKLETTTPLRLKGPFASWQGKARRVYNSRRLTELMRRRMITLRLQQIASQQASNGGLSITRAFKPNANALATIPELKQVWRARSHERLQQALDKAQVAILKALESDNPRQNQTAASLMLRTKQARERGFTGICT